MNNKRTVTEMDTAITENTTSDLRQAKATV